ncbi:MAG TPA: hypothetical protein PLF81_22535, partial [Candidatus Anammoximicrobium sp.]|nr:hypothetical protein [Candidatus Anammoximicrobium sp.]
IASLAIVTGPVTIDCEAITLDGLGAAGRPGALVNLRQQYDRRLGPPGQQFLQRWPSRHRFGG